MESGQYLTSHEVCRLFKLSPRTLAYLVATKQVPFSRVGKRSIRFDLERLKDWFKEREGVEYHVKNT